MQVKFDNDIREYQTDDRVKKQFRVTITASFLVDDDEHIEIHYRAIDEDDLPTDEDGDVDEEKMEADGIEWDEHEHGYHQERDIAKDPVTLEEFTTFLTENYDSSFSFIEDEGLEEKFSTHIVEVDADGNNIVPPFSRNQPETT